MSWVGEVVADNGGNWSRNALRFATREEAGLYIHDLAGRWTMVSNWRVVESLDPVNAAWRDDRLHFIGDS